MARQIVLDSSVLRLWAVRSLFLGLGDRQPAVISPRWSPGTLAELQVILEADLSARHGPDAADAAGRIVSSLTDAYPEAEVQGVPETFELDLLDRRDADVAAAAAVAGALVVATTAPERFPAVDVAHIGLTALHPDHLLLDLYANDPWKVFHTTIATADTLRTPGRPVAWLVDRLAADVPEFAAVIRARLEGLPRNQPEGLFVATRGQSAPPYAGREMWCIRCDPVPCRGHDGSRIRLLGTDAACFSDECTFVGVTHTADHWTLVWPSEDDSSLRAEFDRLADAGLEPRVVLHTPDLGPPLDHLEWMVSTH